ncbi:glucan biosynthesis protein G [Marinobacter halodurans]|uniref:Glucans biosynthesis protein G n=1 Tax=Marinobacter halodurans TaxID=2528979 RepID=A0ABY1ZGZ9_9GAMM|nr:glucan biosynthesis protein G [Marinobacter halodurans]TBW51559.1 glucan biosynthesis protein G [Marinobacter halodurans]
MLSARLLLFLLAPVMLLATQTASAFGLDDVEQMAKARAGKPFEAPAPAPQFLRDLSYSDYQAVRFKPEASLWREGRSRFQVRLFPPGSYYAHAVKLHQVDSQGVEPITFDKANFNYPNDAFAKRVPADLGYAGFKLAFPLHKETNPEQFMVFGGASYFRGLGRDNRFGLSARGIAINTGLPSGEEVPSFVEFWLERPAGGSDTMRVYALLDGPSLTGAYQFDIHPGDSTRVDVTAKLFFRDHVDLLGLAPLTSMFYYGENTVRPVGEWRPQVHDSDGLLIHDGDTGEWLWRPLLNPRKLRMSYLQAQDLKGFGLMQRNTRFYNFEDMEARYDKRPSAWVETKGDWGKGHVVLVEIPTRSEVNDNIVAFWQPESKVKAGDERTLQYTLSFGGPSIANQPTAHAMQTFVGEGNRIGGGNVDGAYRLIVDFKGGELDKLKPDAPVVSQVTGGDHVKVIEHFVEYNEPSNAWRLSMLVQPEPDADMTLRGFLSMDGKPLTETWTYQLPVDSDLRTPKE